MNRHVQSRSLRLARLAFAVVVLAAATIAPVKATALPLGRMDNAPVTLDVTETSIVAQRFEARAHR